MARLWGESCAAGCQGRWTARPQSRSASSASLGLADHAHDDALGLWCNQALPDCTALPTLAALPSCCSSLLVLHQQAVCWCCMRCCTSNLELWNGKESELIKSARPNQTETKLGPVPPYLVTKHFPPALRERLVFYCRTTSASTAPRTPRRTCCPYAYALITVLRVSRSCELFPDGFDLHLLPFDKTLATSPQSGRANRHLRGPGFLVLSRKVDVRLPGKGNSTPNGARPVSPPNHHDDKVDSDQ